MTQSRLDHSRLDQVVTSWTIVEAMKKTLPPSDKESLWRAFLSRYERVVRRYLIAVLRDEEHADEVYSRFLERCLTSVVPRADRAKGRFRDFVKTVLINLMRNFRASQGVRNAKFAPLPDDVAQPKDEAPPDFDVGWREHLVQRAMEAFKQSSQRADLKTFTVLQYKLEHPQSRSADLAEHFSKEHGKPRSPEWVRKQLLLARQRLAELLVREVEQTLDQPTPEDVAEEVAALGLMDQCRQALAAKNK